MTISGFTMVRNATKLYYPIKASDYFDPAHR